MADHEPERLDEIERDLNTHSDELLGKRHHYKDDDTDRNLAHAARSLGFSPDEVMELERLYQQDSMKDTS